MTNISKIKSKLFPLIILIVLGVLFFTLTHKTKAPDVTFITIEGKPIHLAELRGKMVLINFWATTCSGCIAEMPELITTYNQYKPKGLEMVAVAMSYDPPSQVLNFTHNNKLPFPVMHDGFDEMATKFKEVRLTPTTFVLDKEGNIVRTIIGAIDFKELHSLLDQQLPAIQAKAI